MKPVTSQDTWWTWLQMTRGPKRQCASLQGLNQKTAKLAWQRFKPKPWRKRRQRPTCKCTQIRDHARSNRGANRGWTGQKGAGAGRPRPADPAWSERGSRPPFALGACLFIASASAGRHIHPFIREPPRRRKSTGRKPTAAATSSCLGDGLGHALATMVGPAWWSHGGLPEPRLEFVKSFVPSTFGDVTISCHTLIYYELCLFICVATICL
jgi:hypothetical protein